VGGALLAATCVGRNQIESCDRRSEAEAGVDALLAKKSKFTAAQKPDAGPAPMASDGVDAAVVSRDSDEPGLIALRQTLAKLSRNPYAVKPTAVMRADDDEPDHDTFEYSIKGAGDIFQDRWNQKASVPGSWDIMVMHADSPLLFAPPDGVHLLDSVGGANWWTVTSGPFEGAFVSTSPGGIMLHSREAICNNGRLRVPNDPLPHVAADCTRR
jgi:hypothetical protein